MCLILTMEPGAYLPDMIWANASVYNPHGLGVSYPENGRVIIEKKLNWDIFDFADRVKQLSDRPRLIHMRYATVGAIDDDNCHPFYVTEGDVPDLNWVMCHNGTIKMDGLVPKDSKWNDSRHFLQSYLQPTMKYNPDIINEPAFQNMIIKMIGISRMAFMNGNGKFVVLNYERGYATKHRGIWMSNGYSIATPWDAERLNPMGAIEGAIVAYLQNEKAKAKEKKIKSKRAARLKANALKLDKETGTYYKSHHGKIEYTAEWPEAIMLESKIENR